MEEKKVTDYTFKRSNQALTLGSKNSLKVGNDEISIDPQNLFQRLVAVSDDTLDNTEEIFTYPVSHLHCLILRVCYVRHKSQLWQQSYGNMVTAVEVLYCRVMSNLY